MLISEELRQQLLANTYSREVKIEIGDNIVIQPANIVSESLEIDSAVMDSDNLVFGGCISSKMSIKVIDVSNIISSGLEGEKIRVYIQQGYSSTPNYPSNDLYPGSTLLPGLTTYSLEQVIYTGYVYSVSRQKKRNVFEIVAFDEMYRMSQTKCKEFIRGELNYASARINTARKFMGRVLEKYDDTYSTNIRNQFISSINAANEFQETYNHFAELNLSRDIFVDKASEKLSISDVLAAHSELNARFAFFNANGELRFTSLFVVKGSGNNRHTEQRNSNVTIDSYNGLQYKDFDTCIIGYISFPYNGGNSRYDYGATSDKRRWYISNNIITTWSTDISAYVTAFKQSSAMNFIFNYISVYRPYSVRTFGEWWIEPGDVISLDTLDTNYPTLKGFVLARRLSGVAGMKVDLEAKGNKWLSQNELEEVTS